MKKVVAIVLFLSASVASFAQLAGPKLINNPFYHNPAYAGINGTKDFLLSTTKSYDNLQTNFSFSDALLDNKLGVGINTGYIHQPFGVSSFEFNTNFAYHHTIGKAGKLSGGVALGFEQFIISDEYLDQSGLTRDIFNEYSGSLTLFEVGLGVNYSSPKGYFSISTPNVLSTSVSKEGKNGSLFELSKSRELAVSAGINIPVSDGKANILPSMTYQRYMNESFGVNINSLDLNTAVVFNQKFRFNLGLTSIIGAEPSAIELAKFDLSLGYMMKNGMRISAQVDIGRGTMVNFVGAENGIIGVSLHLGYRLSKNTEDVPVIKPFF